MSTVDLTLADFETTVTSHDMVLVDFWAEWCGPCRMFAPYYAKVSEEFPDAVFGKVDTEANPELASMFNIQSIPTLMIIRDQVVIFSQAGALPEAALRDLVEQAKAVDMEKVHADIAAQKAETA
ncbi:MAG: thioredoxin [Acidimicrobiaceae bacterium]|nr:thioredoxin [Acidimicrobiaceae bacterium]